MFGEQLRLYDVDLEVDVLVRGNGDTYAITHRDRLEHARAEGWITGAEHVRAVQGLEELLGYVSRWRT
jgi:predicted RNA-binding protein associated with RNAse of E/G family